MNLLFTNINICRARKIYFSKKNFEELNMFYNMSEVSWTAGHICLAFSFLGYLTGMRGAGRSSGIQILLKFNHLMLSYNNFIVSSYWANCTLVFYNGFWISRDIILTISFFLDGSYKSREISGGFYYIVDKFIKNLTNRLETENRVGQFEIGWKFLWVLEKIDWNL